MAASVSKRSRKASKFAWLIGLAIILLVALPLIIFLLMKRNRKSDNLDIIEHSEYSTIAPFVVAQAKHESANFTSNVYKKNNNPFGMKVPSQRSFLGTVGTKAPDGGYYAAYENDTVAFKDYLKWLRARQFPVGITTVEEFVDELKAKGYFTDSVSNYLKGVKRFL